MSHILHGSTKWVQNADDSLLFVANESHEKSTRLLEKIIEKLFIYFDHHCLNLNEEKTEFIIF